MEGDFKIGGGVINLPSLTYTVTGATIELTGKYGIVGGSLDFTGNAKMDASVSQMVGGWKGLLLSPLDRYLKRDGAGTEIPIHIRGNRDKPQFGVDIDRIIKKRPSSTPAPSESTQPSEEEAPAQATDPH